MTRAMPSPDAHVKLNIGGVRFETSRATLTSVPDSMLGRMFGRCDLMLQLDPEDGSVFIDRNGQRFGLILDFLRDHDGSRTATRIGALSEEEQQAVLQELDYYGLQIPVFGERPWIADADS